MSSIDSSTSFLNLTKLVPISFIPSSLKPNSPILTPFISLISTLS